jgi:hypothetical protein
MSALQEKLVNPESILIAPINKTTKMITFFREKIE